MRLHGFPISNYYNIAKLALLEKGLSFEEVVNPPRREEDFLKISPAGKIPVLECEQGHLAETRAILAYLDMREPEPPLLPSDPFACGLAEQIFAFINLYVDGAVRPMFGAAYFGQPVDQDGLVKMNEDLRFAVSGLRRLVRFAPFVAGDCLSLADLAATITLPLAAQTTAVLQQPDLLDLDGFPEYLEMMRSRPTVQRVTADAEKALAGMR